MLNAHRLGHGGEFWHYHVPVTGGSMEELDFVGKPARPASPPAPVYNPAIALEFFQSAGKPESVPSGTKFFVENQKASRILLKRDKMYLLLEGEGELLAHGKPIGAVKT